MSAQHLGIAAVVIVVLLVLLVGFAGFGLVHTTSTVTVTEHVEAPVTPPSDGSSGVVSNLIQLDGLSILGVTIRRDQYEAHIGMVAPPECVRTTESGAQELLSNGDCADLPVHGDLSGGGTTVTGDEFVFVRVEVSEACFQELERGDPWPAPTGACAAE